MRSSTWVNDRLRTIQSAIRRIPRIGDEVEDVLHRWYHSLQGVIPQQALGVIFEELGFFTDHFHVLGVYPAGELVPPR